MFSSNLKHSTPWATCVVLILAASAQADDFPQVFNTQNQADKLSTPQEALKGMRVPQGFQVSLFAEEPAVQQPIGFTTDERGRLWVAENYTYVDRSKDYDLSLRDRILIFEDTNHDGRFDKRTVFWDGAQKLTSVAVGFGGVWALCAPNLLFLPDKNRDDVPDGPPQVVLDGFNHDAIRHNIVNGLKWGPDGWLYGCHGITATSSVGLPGATDSQRTKLNCSLWRYHPTHKNFEVITHGTTNPWGFDYDDHGQMFLINTVIGHLWHVVPGAHFQRMFGSDFNPYLYQLLPQAAAIAVSGPDAITVNVPASAPVLPPVTGASMNRWPDSLSRSAIARACSGAMVVLMTTVAPAPSVDTAPSSPNKAVSA